MALYRKFRVVHLICVQVCLRLKSPLAKLEKSRENRYILTKTALNGESSPKEQQDKDVPVLAQVVFSP